MFQQVDVNNVLSQTWSQPRGEKKFKIDNLVQN
jgi:hypothetical protein